jgi:hypothetical protein
LGIIFEPNRFHSSGGARPFTVDGERSASAWLAMQIQQVLADLDLGGKVVVEKSCQ